MNGVAPLLPVLMNGVAPLLPVECESRPFIGYSRSEGRGIIYNTQIRQYAASSLRNMAFVSFIKTLPAFFQELTLYLKEQEGFPCNKGPQVDQRHCDYMVCTLDHETLETRPLKYITELFFMKIIQIKDLNNIKTYRPLHI